MSDRKLRVRAPNDGYSAVMGDGCRKMSRTNTPPESPGPTREPPSPRKASANGQVVASLERGGDEHPVGKFALNHQGLFFDLEHHFYGAEFVVKKGGETQFDNVVHRTMPTTIRLSKHSFKSGLPSSCANTSKVRKHISRALLTARVSRARVTIGSVTLRGGALRIRSSTGSTPRL